MAFAVIVSGERFTFTRSQLESDPDNLFTIYFLDPFVEASQKKHEMEIEMEPALFKLIQAHLRGYDILPIPDGYIPYMSDEVVLGNLLKEAAYYALSGLVQKIKEFQTKFQTKKPQVSTKDRYMLTKCEWKRDKYVYTKKYLGEAEYIALLRQVNGVKSRELLATGGNFEQEGYSVSISWTDYYSARTIHYALLIRNE